MTRIISDEVTIIAPLSAELESEKEETQSAHLIVLSGTNVGQVFELNKPEITIGRDDNVAVQIMDVGISRRHATILRDKLGAYFLHDAGSRNGTFANGHRVEGKHHLQDGDKIQIGVLTILKFTYSDAPEVEYAHVMYEAALRDGLTGIFNRRYFEERIKAEFAYALRHNSALALLILDLDLFKHINDSYGHPVGDQVLQELSKLVGKTCRTEDVLSRYGGEEFAIICRDTDSMEASILGERIRHEVAAFCFTAEERQLKLTVSIGIAALPEASIKTPEALVLAADEALYQAKDRGRNCVITKRSHD